MVWKIEYADRKELEAVQLQRLKDVVKRVYEHVPYYTSAFEERGITPDDVRSLDDLQKLPVTDKETLRQYYPFDLFTVPMAEVAEIHASSGTTGNPRTQPPPSARTGRSRSAGARRAASWTGKRP